VSEPAILVKRKDEASQVWSMEKLDLKLIDMRELYEELKSRGVNFTNILRARFFIRKLFCTHSLALSYFGKRISAK